MPVWNSIIYRERRRGSPSGSFIPRGESRLQTQYWMEWSDILSGDAQSAFLGEVRVSTANNVRYISRTLPFQFPHLGLIYYADAFDRFEGAQAAEDGMTGNDAANFTEGLVAVGFKAFKKGYRLFEDAKNWAPGANTPSEAYCNRAMEVTVKSTTKAQTIPAASGLYWDVPGAVSYPVSAAMFVTLWEQDITLKWGPLPLNGFNDAGFDQIIGSTNAEAFPPLPPDAYVAPDSSPRGGAPVSLLGQYAAGQLLMGNYEKDIERQGTGDYCYWVTLRIKAYKFGANSFYWWNRPSSLGGPGYQLIKRRDGTRLFPSRSWTPAFAPP